MSENEKNAKRRKKLIEETPILEYPLLIGNIDVEEPDLKTATPNLYKFLKDQNRELERISTSSEEEITS